VLGLELLPVLLAAPTPQALGAAHEATAWGELLPQLEAHPAGSRAGWREKSVHPTHKTLLCLTPAGVSAMCPASVCNRA
jgi:hypothetical protein